MPALTRILKELWGLFVDDGSLALALVVWVAVCGLGLPRIPAIATVAAPILFLGCLAILIFNVMQTARRKRPAKTDG